MGKPELLEAYVALIDSLINARDYEAAAFALETAVEIEERCSADEIAAARELLPVEITLWLTERSLERYLARVQAALRMMDDEFANLKSQIGGQA